MSKTMSKVLLAAGALGMLLALPAQAATVNKSIKIGAGEESDGATSVNGSITIGADAVVSGGVKTVNGKIRVDDGATIRKASSVNGSVVLGDGVKSRSLGTVNGTIRMGRNCEVDGHIEAVNGRISVEKGSTVADHVESVNGEVEIVGSVIAGDLATVNGDVELAEGSVVKGNLRVEKPSSWGWGKSPQRKPRIVIGPGSRVEGVVDLEREVELYISETAEVGGVEGEMSLDDAVRFSGKKP